MFASQNLPSAGADTASVIKGNRGLYLNDNNVTIPQEVYKIVIAPSPR
jgi:hypothetical protein